MAAISGDPKTLVNLIITERIIRAERDHGKPREQR